MCTVVSGQQYPDVVKALTGLPAEEFWRLVGEVSARWADQRLARLARPHRQRASGGGRQSAQPLKER